jgi:AcrR family transcriptional regulator
VARRRTLSLDRIIAAAVAVADDHGLGGVTMRNVGQALEVEAMSLYHYVATKDALLDELSGWVYTRLELPVVGSPWRSAMEARCRSMRAVLRAHPWALGLIDTRRRPPATLLCHHDATLGCLRTDGFSVDLAAHAVSALDAYVYGFVLTEVNLPFAEGEPVEGFVTEIAEQHQLDDYPFLSELIAEQVIGRDYNYSDQFDDGLAMILDQLRHRLALSA